MSIGSWLVNAWEGGLHWTLRHVPVEMASSIGSFVVRTNVKFNRPEIIAGARRNLAIHRPGIGEAEIDASVYRFLDNVGRFMSEFSVLPRMQSEDRIELVGVGPSQALQGTAPIVAIGLHTGNWEAFGPACQMAGLKVATFYEIPPRAAQRRIAEETRRKLGFELLQPNSSGLREAISILKQNRIVAIFGDEARGGHTMAPLFGRPPHTHGNLALAARLTRFTNAQIVIFHSERLNGCRFRMHFSSPFKLPAGKSDLLADVVFLNSRIEPIVLEHIDRWYYLDDSIAPLQEAPA